MMNAQALQERLQHYSYHWFWGLRYSSVPLESNLGTSVVALNNNPVLLQQLERQRNRLSGFHPLRLFMHRLFNIDNCNAHYYQLCAFHAYQGLSHMVLEEEVMPRDTTVQSVIQQFSSPWSKFKHFFSSDLNHLEVNPLAASQNNRALVIQDTSQQDLPQPQNNLPHEPLDQKLNAANMVFNAN